MSRFVLLVGFSLLAVSHAFAQESSDLSAMQCNLVKQAVAQYGYAAARQHALETYGPEAVRVGDKCLAKATGSGLRAHGRGDLEADRDDGMNYRR